ncbi:MAG TPA: hypothetical protein VK668_10735 [Mucilaginibacter sp.]|nr:hypothetical protein [Mucilaginibacter sp.]
MKKLFTLLLIIVCSHAFAQDSLKTFNADRIRTTANGMAILGGWGVANLGVGAIGWSGSTTPQSRYFYQMNVIWGAADFGAALLGYAGTQKYKKKTLTATETIREQNRIEKVFFVNGCFDVAYLGVGTYLTLAGNSRNSPIMKGYGTSILMQGGFLLLFDGLMYKAEKGNGTKLRAFLEKHPISFDGRRIGITFNM